LITVDEVRLQPRAYAAPMAAHMPAAPVTPAAISLLHTALFLMMLISPIIFIEPSPYEAAGVLLGFTFILARVPLVRAVLPMMILLLVWNLSGAAALLPVINDEMAVRFTVISFYLAFTAVIYACIFAQDTMHRLSIMRRGYLIAAFFVALTGIAGYFNLFPGAGALLAPSGRATGTFKDPNVFGPFLILPLLLLAQTMLTRSIKLRDTVVSLVLLLGLFLSFSRGAWMHFGVSIVVLGALVFVTATTVRMRGRVVLVSAAAIVMLTTLLIVALSIESIGDMFQNRARLLQDYDVSSGGRFTGQLSALSGLLDRPNGFGPQQLHYFIGGDPHEVYINSFAAYGWLGGIAYISLVVITLIIGLRGTLMRTPWQPYMIAVYAAFVGEVAEGAVIDTDHWRHYFLLLGLIWGLTAANLKLSRENTLRSETGLTIGRGAKPEYG
jgi:hypothetical protein